MIITELDREGEDIVYKFNEMIEEAEKIKVKKEALYKDVESGMKLTLHNVVNDY
jgi:5S rRNA maturation endonuclease (ribonuclease M5)